MSRPNNGRTIGSEENLARRITMERNRRGLSYEALAKLMTDMGCNIHGSAIFKIEKADPPRNISVNELVAFGRVFELEIDDLLTPIEVLEIESGKELIRELQETHSELTSVIFRLLAAQMKWLSLIHDNPELFVFVQNQQEAHMNGPDMGWYHRDPERLPKLKYKWISDTTLDYDYHPFLSDVAEFGLRIYDEAKAIETHKFIAKKKAQSHGKH